jgi:putative flippase GtrA
MKQIIRFGIVGVLATIVDYSLMLLFVEVFHINYLISCVMSFIVSVIFNYVLSTKYVFDVSEKKSKKDFIIFVILSAIGLGISSIVMYLGVDFIHIDYRIVKVFATGIVMVYNFITRKIFLEHKKK